MNEQDALIDLGFTKMEAAVYIYLLGNPAQTGYAISKSLGEAAPYVYRTLDSLAQKGAILKELGEKSLYRAVPFQELINQMSRLYEQRCVIAGEALDKLKDIKGDERIYALTTVEQVYERCRSMLSRCKNLVYMDLYPEPFTHLKEDISACSKNGNRIFMFLYEETEIEATRIFRIDPSRIIKHWKRQWIRICVDGSEYLVALLNSDGSKVYHAIWSENPVISWTQMYSLRSEFQLADQIRLLDGNADIETLRENLSTWRQWDIGKQLPGELKIEVTYDGLSAQEKKVQKR